METLNLKPERKAQLEEYARRHGMPVADALDDLLAAQLDSERKDYEEAVEGIREGYEDFKAGRIQDSNQAFAELRAKHGFSR